MQGTPIIQGTPTTKKMKKTEPRFVVYLRRTAVKLTTRNPAVFIEREIKFMFGGVVSIQLRGVSLKITCRDEKQ